MTQSKKPPTLLLTGATGHIGRAFAKEVSSFSSLILVDNDDDQLNELHDILSKKTVHKHYVINCDLSSEPSRHTLIKKIKEMHPHLNGLINNAAFTGDTNLDGWVSSFQNQSLDAWRAAFEVNLTAAFDLSKGLSPLLKKKPRWAYTKYCINLWFPWA